MNISNIMSHDIAVAHTYTSIEQAAVLMRVHDVGMLPVVADGKVLGVVTDRDIVVRGLADGKDGMVARVTDVMTPQPITCHQDDDVEDAVSLMAHWQVRRLPVVDDAGRMTGVISLGDLAISEEEDAASFVLGEVSEPVPPTALGIAAE